MRIECARKRTAGKTYAQLLEKVMPSAIVMSSIADNNNKAQCVRCVVQDCAIFKFIVAQIARVLASPQRLTLDRVPPQEIGIDGTNRYVLCCILIEYQLLHVAVCHTPSISLSPPPSTTLASQSSSRS